MYPTETLCSRSATITLDRDSDYTTQSLQLFLFHIDHSFKYERDKGRGERNESEVVKDQKKNSLNNSALSKPVC